jgi:CheY-like chemotaxis protein
MHTPRLATDANPTCRSLRVLVVDDNQDAARIFAVLLRSVGHDVRTSHDGPSALEAAINYLPDAVLLDLGLPGMSGFDVAKRMRQEPSLANVVLIALTGYGRPEDRQQSLDAGVDHHLIKPAEFEQVRQILASASLKQA